jgi:hypothetical protein
VTYLLAAFLVAVTVAGYAYRYGLIVSHDGVAYLLAAGGVRQPSPYRWRLLPHLFRRWLPPKAKLELAARTGGAKGAGEAAHAAVMRWSALSAACLVACGPLLALYAEQRGVPGLLAVAIWAGLPWLRACVRMPCLTDQAGAAAALVAGCLSGSWWLVAVGLVAGLVSERAVVFAALLAWSPLPLLGLAIPAAVALTTRPGTLWPWQRGILDHPWASALESHRAAPLWHLSAPWGLALVGLASGGVQLFATLAVAYGQLMVATDRVRLYQSAAPALCVAAAGVASQWPAWVVGVAMVAHWTWSGSEVRG